VIATRFLEEGEVGASVGVGVSAIEDSSPGGVGVSVQPLNKRIRGHRRDRINIKDRILKR